MATNENVNKVIYGNQTIMDITDTTAEESDVLVGKSFYKASGQKSSGTLDPYVVGDTAETDIADGDYFPFYDTSASGKRKTLWSNIKAKLKTYFDTIYSTFSGSYNDLTNKPTIPTVDQTYSATSSNAQSGTAVAEVVEQIYADNGVLGAKNLLPFPYKEGTKTLEGVTFTVNTDGSVTANGTATNTSYIYLFQNEVYKMGKECILNGCPANGSDNTYKIIFKDETTGVYYEDKGNGIVIPSYVNTHTITSYIRIGSGTTANNLTFYPMLRLASDPDDTYVPYAMTNRELTEAIASVPTVNNGQLTIQQNGTNKATFTANQSGNATANIITDTWTKTKTVSSSGTVSFSGLNDSYGYKIYYTLPSGDSAYTFSKVTKSGSGTSVTLTYTTNAPSGTVCKLRILK